MDMSGPLSNSVWRAWRWACTGFRREPIQGLVVYREGAYRRRYVYYFEVYQYIIAAVLL